MRAVSFEMSSISPKGTVLARYSLSSEDREVVGYRYPPGIALFDRPAAGAGEGYLIDRGIFWSEPLEGLVGEYVEHALRLGCPPASKQGIGACVDAMEPGEAEAFLLVRAGWS